VLRVISIVLALGLLATACGGTAQQTASPTPTDASGGPLSIEVTMTDALAYDPEEFRVTVGQTVRFVVHNAGQIVHEFYIGDEDDQQHHEEEMRGQGMQHDDPSGVSVEPGGTETLEYTFSAPGELLAGCHEPGHYAGGMVAAITVEAP
jgi:uncharacterized cupredoxin-like copper-binding protein